MAIKIEKGIKIPPRGGCGKPIGEFRKTLLTMKVGDSVVVKKNQNLVYAIGRAAGIKVATRKINQGGEIRVWRVK